MIKLGEKLPFFNYIRFLGMINKQLGNNKKLNPEEKLLIKVNNDAEIYEIYVNGSKERNAVVQTSVISIEELRRMKNITIEEQLEEE